MRIHRAVTLVAVATVAALAFGTFQPARSVAANPVLTSLTQKTCLSWSYFQGQPWHCKKWFSQAASLGIDGSNVYAQRSSGWHEIPYVYNSSNKTATYDYRRDTGLQRPAFKSAGNSSSYAFASSKPKAAPTKKVQLRWKACNVFIGYSIDYHGIKGTKLNKAVEAARWRKAFSIVTAAVPNQRFRDLSTSSTVYRPTASGKAFADQQIHITYSTKASGPYHSKFVTAELGYGGLNWSLNQNGSFNRIEWGFIIVDATKASNIHVWPSPGRAKGVDELLTLYLHEIGHALGLTHTNDKYQLMYPVLMAQKPNTLGAGDRAAYRKLFPPMPCPTHVAQ
jgi:hypothetical protein